MRLAILLVLLPWPVLLLAVARGWWLAAAMALLLMLAGLWRFLSTLWRCL